MVELIQASGPMAKAWQALYQAVMEKRIVHDGDPDLASHVEAAAADKTERGWQVRKLKSKKIDALVAAAMAHSRCRLRGGGSKVFFMDPFGNDLTPSDKPADGDEDEEEHA